jgi:hypothetical protein
MHTVEVSRVVNEIEAAEILGVARRTLQDWRFRGVGPRFLSYTGKRGAVRYRVADLEAFMERAARTSTSDPGRAA